MTKKREVFAFLTGGFEPKRKEAPVPKDEPEMEDEEYDEADLREEEPDEAMTTQARALIEALGVDTADERAVAKALARFVASC